MSVKLGIVLDAARFLTDMRRHNREKVVFVNVMY